MSKIIKQTRIVDPALLQPYQPPVLERKVTADVVRSLEFDKTIRDELGIWHRKCTEYRNARKQSRDRLVEKAYQNGYERGFEDGLSRERSDHLASIDALFQEAKRKKERAIRDQEVKVIELAVSIAERIISRSLELDPEAVTGIIREVMSNIITGETVVLKVSEEDLAPVNARYEQWLGMSGNAREFRIEADKRLRRGDCVVETEGGIVDAIIASRLDFLVEELLKR